MEPQPHSAPAPDYPWPFADQLPYPVTLRRPDDVLVHANPAALAHFGYALEDVVGRKGEELHKDSFGQTLHAVHQRLFSQVLADGASHSELVRTPGEQGLGLARITVFRMTWQGDTLLGSMLIDETDNERARIAEDHRREVARMDDSLLSSFIHNSPVILLLRDRDLTFIDVSDTVCRIFNIARSDFVGRDDIDIALDKPAAKARQDVLRSVVETGEPVLVEETFPAVPGLVVLFHHFPLLDRHGEPMAVGTVGMDVSRWREAERLVDNQARQLQQFTIASAHDLKEPLRTITSYLSMVLEDLDAEGQVPQLEQLRRRIQAPLDSALRMGALVNGMMELGSINQRTLAPAQVGMDALLDAVRDDLAERIRDTGGQVLSRGLGTVWGDPVHLRQLLQNLVSNGLKFHHPDTPPVVRVSVQVHRAGTTLLVADNGIGVPEEAADKVFNAFERLHPHSRYEGSGLGLALCQAIVHRHGGTISMHRNLRTGTVVVCELPPAPAV